MEENYTMTDFVIALLYQIAKFLAFLFCALRACGVVDWPWYIVIIPATVYWITPYLESDKREVDE